MEPVIRSRKRKQRPSESDPFGGIFTRSRSQIYSHRHRSGYARSESNRSRNLFKSLECTANSIVKQEQSEVLVDQVTSQVSVKDLRARRVFSPALISDEVEEVDLEADFDVHKKNDGNPNVSFSDGDAGRSDFGVFESVVSDVVEVDLEAVLDAYKKNDGNPSVSLSEGDAGHSDLGVSKSAVVDLQASSEDIVDPSSVRVNNVMEADGVAVVQMAPTMVESEENKMPGGKHEMISAANEIADTKEIMNKCQPSVTSLRGRRKVFKSPTSFNYRRLLPYIMDSGNDGDSSSFEIVDATLPQNLKSSNPVSSMVALKDEEIGLVSNSSKMAAGLLNNVNSSVNADLINTVESSDVVQKSQEDVLSDTLECEQTTPPDSNIYSKSKIDNVSDVLVKPTSKLPLKSCTRRKILQTPTSFSHRRLLPFLMSVAGDYSCPIEGNQSLKLEKALEQNQQASTHSLLHQDEKSTAVNETSNSPTSTLIPVDKSTDITDSVTLVSNDNNLDANGPGKEGSGPISELDVDLQGEVVKFDSCIKMEQSPPKNSLKCVEEATVKATPPCIEQSYSEEHQIIVKEGPTSEVTLPCIEQNYSEDHHDKVSESPTFEGTPPSIEQSYSEDHQITVKESPTSEVTLLCVEQNYSEDHHKKVKESPTFEGTPPCVEQSYSKDHHKKVKESPTSEVTPPYLEQRYSQDHLKEVEESPQQYMLQISETQGEVIRNGILKRTPRGCRGICNCLNCTSFRLHAERSFEFSKNQMHDAEEVALELINDLTCLRNILETTAKDTSSFDTLKEKQVREACANALYNEQAARARLAQMNEDLSIHCRSMNLLRPKVTFANKVEEKVISKGKINEKKSV